MTQSPDQKVAETITASLRGKKLVAESRLSDLTKKLLAGSLTSADWRRIAEASLDEERKATDANPH